jgi:hypothetical protein
MGLYVNERLGVGRSVAGAAGGTYWLEQTAECGLGSLRRCLPFVGLLSRPVAVLSPVARGLARCVGPSFRRLQRS